ncbi:hypothetical protein HUB97_10160 [Halorubraceae archaeon YAN]|nr:hypothetical protein [Halorubraceae archaeon YAN]
MSGTLRTPTKRVCELCDRAEKWDTDSGSWVVDTVPGNIYCIHEWDINGTFVPFEE